MKTLKELIWPARASLKPAGLSLSEDCKARLSMMSVPAKTRWSDLQEQFEIFAEIKKEEK